MLYSFPDSWDNLVMTIGRNNTILKLDDVVETLLSKEMRQNTIEGSNYEEMSMRG